MSSLTDIVAGAGIWGCTVARRLAEAGHKVLVLEKRAAVGGNCRCETDSATGIETHLYGSHIFHTRNEEVWGFVNRFAKFNDYRHCVLARYKDRTYHLPIGCTLLKEFFGRDLKPSELTLADRAAVFDAFVRGYTSKQWGVPPEKVPASVIARLKVRDSSSTDYFDDPHQGIPVDGYNALFERMLDHPNITVECDAEFKVQGSKFKVQGSRFEDLELPQVPVYYSGPIDALLDYKFGALPWRTLNFELETLNCSDFQGASVVNYTEAEVPYTRIHEFKHYHPERTESLAAEKTVIMREYPKTWAQGDEPYYPVNNEESSQILAKYMEELDKYKNLIIGGRLGEFKYYDMDQSIAQALNLKII